MMASKRFDRPVGMCAGRRRGFTLLEIMIALAIISIALVSLLSLGNRSLGVNGRLQHITRATLLAQQVMTETEHQAQTRGASVLQDAEGVFDEPFAAYRWQRTIAGTPLPAVRQVTISVQWGEAQHNEQVDVVSFLF